MTSRRQADTGSPSRQWTERSPSVSGLGAGRATPTAAPPDLRLDEILRVSSEPGMGAGGAGLGQPEVVSIASLQRTAGNKAVSTLLDGARRPGESRGGRAGRSIRPVVQRHSSFEHSIFGNTKPSDLATAAGSIKPQDRKHVVDAERDRALFFQKDPAATPNPSAYPFDGVQLVQLEGSGLWVTYGEINALADYLPNGEDINRRSKSQIKPILQYMRHEIAQACADLASANQVGAGTLGAPGWTGSQQPTVTEQALGKLSPAAARVKVEEDATATRGFQSYTGLLSRNACHFAPDSWIRYAINHAKALENARKARWYENAQMPENALGTSFVEEAASRRTQALVDSGYADHFLEDSFAAGHLINKTLVMQWFMEWVQSQDPASSAGLPSKEMANTLSEGRQGRMAGQDLYGAMTAGTIGTKAVVVDPQSASEMRGGGMDAEARAMIAGADLSTGSSTRKTANLYYEFFRLTSLQLASGRAHDYLNAMAGGLTVKNKRGDVFTVGGDDTGLQNSNARGLAIIGEAVEASRQSVLDALATGTPSKTTDEILALVPSIILADNKEVSLEQWNQTWVRNLCVSTLFPALWKDPKFDAARHAGATDETANPDLAATM